MSAVHSAAAPAHPSSNDSTTLPQQPSHTLTSSSNASALNTSYNDSTPLAGDDVDAEGSVDSQYDVDVDQAPHANGGVEVPRRSSVHSDRSASDASSSKKKQGQDDLEAAIRNNPELYGIRRTERRTRAPLNHFTEDSEGDSDPDLAPQPVAKRRKTNNTHVASRHASPEPEQDSSEDDDDSEDYDVPRSRKQAGRRLQKPAPRSKPSSLLYEPEKRISSRNVGRNVATYAEDDDDEFDDSMVAEWIEEVPGEVRPTVEIDAVVGHKIKDTSKPKSALVQDDLEYLIKWKGKSYHELQWHESAALVGTAGWNKIKNYAAEHLEYERLLANDNVTPEVKEEIGSILAERADQIALRKRVERIVQSRLNDETQRHEYYIKWKGIEYADNTWELSSFIQELAPERIEHFKQRRKQEKLMKSDPLESNPRTRGAFKLLEDQPSYVVGGQLRDFQMKGLNFLAANWTKARNVILADEMGLGKTVQTIAFIQWLRHDRNQQGPFLVIVPLSTIGAWVDTFEKWSPDLNFLVYHGGKGQAKMSRQIIRDTEFWAVNEKNGKYFPKFHCLLTTPELVNADLEELRKIKWQFMAVDEAHRLKDSNSVLYRSLVALEAQTRLLITGTPIQNNLKELAALIRFINPREVIPTEEIDMADEGAGNMIRELRTIIEPYMIRRTKKLVEKDLPPKIERTLRVELSDVALDLYKDLVGRNAAMEDNSDSSGQTRIVRSAVNNLVMELKKVSDHPLLCKDFQEQHAHLTSKEERLRLILSSSGKMMLLEQLLEKLRKDNHRVLIFCQLVGMMDILSEYLHYRGVKYQRLDGTVAAKDREAAIEHFNAPDSEDQVFLLSTRAGGMGINLATADTVILFDSDWNPQQDSQAMSRAHRIGQKKQVTVYRLVSKDTIEEDILERARNKLMLEFLTIQAPDREKAQLNKELASKGAIGEAKDAAEINRILKSRGQKMFEQEGNQRKLEELNIDSVLADADDYETEQMPGMGEDSDDRVAKFLDNFKFNDVKVEMKWDDIIPKADFERIKKEEYEKASQEEARRLEEENRPRKRNATKRDPVIEAAAADDDDDDDDADDGDSDSKKRSKRTGKRVEKKRAKVGAGSDEDDDPSRPLNAAEIGKLIDGCTTFGPLDYRPKRLLPYARLEGRDITVLQQTWDDLVAEAKVQKERILSERAEKERLEQKAIPKKQAGEPMMEWRGQKFINCDTVLLRPKWMRLLGDVVDDFFKPDKEGKVPAVTDFSIDVETNDPDFGQPWGKVEDMMLLLGVYRHGHGRWYEIRQDAELGLGDKLFLDEEKAENKKKLKEAGLKKRKPEAVHLVRRAKYLLTCVAALYSDDSEAQKQFDNYHRNKQKITPMGNASNFANSTGSPLTGMHGKAATGKARPRLSESHNELRPGSSQSRAESHSGLNGSSSKPKQQSAEPKSKPKIKRHSDHLDSDESQHVRKKVKAEVSRSPEHEHSLIKKRPVDIAAVAGATHSPKRLKSEGSATPISQEGRAPLYSNAFSNLKPKRKKPVDDSRGRLSEGRKGSERPDSRRGRSRSPARESRPSKSAYRSRTPEDGPRIEPRHSLPNPNGGLEMEFDESLKLRHSVREAKELVKKRLGEQRNAQRDELILRIPEAVECLKKVGASIERLSRGESFKSQCWDYAAAHYWVHDIDTGNEFRKLYQRVVSSNSMSRKPSGQGSGQTIRR